MLKNVAGQNITALLLDTDGAAVTTGTTTVYVTGDAGTQASMGTATHEGNGAWSIDVTQAESNYDDIGFTWVNTGAVTVHQHVFTDQTYDRLGAPAGASVSADVADIPTVAEFEARTLVAASYFDPAADTVATVTAVTNGVTLANGAVTNASLAGNMEIVFETDFATNYNTTTDAWVTNYTNYLGTIPAAALGADCITAAKIADDAFSNEHFAAAALTSSEVTSVGSVDNLSTSSSAINTTSKPSPNGFVITTGTSEVNNEDSTFALDGTTHDIEDTAGTTDVYYEFDVGSNGVPVSITWHGYVNAVGDVWGVYAYNWITPGWEQVGSLSGANGTTILEEKFDLTTSHVGTGANVGLVRFRFYSTGPTGGTKLATDRILCSYAQAASGISNGSSVTLSATTSNTNLIGNNWTLALGGQDISGSYIEGATVTGISSGSTDVTFYECLFGAATLPPGKYIRCGIGVSDGTFTLASNGDYYFHECYSAVAGSGTPDISATALGAATTINNRGWTGGITYDMDSNVTLSHEVLAGGGTNITTGGGDAEIRGTCRSISLTLSGAETVQFVGVTGDITLAGTTSGSASTINLFGVTADVTDSTAGLGVTLTDDSVSRDNINIEADTALSDYDPPTNAEMEARTLVAASYFDPAADTVANVTTVATTTDVTNQVTADVTGISGSATAADNLEASALGIVPGACEGTPSTTVIQTNLAETTDDHYIGRVVVFTSGNASGQATDITDYTGATGTITVTALTTAPAATDTFVIV